MKQILKKYNLGISMIILVIAAVIIGIILAVVIFGYNSITNKFTDVAKQTGLEWVTIGTQKWAKTNLNVGTMITGDKDQTNNSVLEKYCYDNDESNCTTYGALYQWDEAMQYVEAEGAQGICPSSSHIPTDNDWKILEMQLGMSQAQADATGWRGTDQGAQLKTNGSSGMNIPLAGDRLTDGSFYYMSSREYLWSSSESSPNIWLRYFNLYNATVLRSMDEKSYGNSVRCLKS